MTDPLTITIAAAIFGVLAFIDVLRANHSLPLFRPSLRHRHEQGSGDVNAERNGGRLPAGMVGNLHSGSNLTTERSNHG